MIRLVSLFSGIGAFEKALDKLNIPYELVGYCEIDKYASKAYSIVHDVPETMNWRDITKVDEKSIEKPIDLITYGFPCQDISRAGKERGLFDENGKKTRSGLFFDALRIINETRPKVALAENVKNLTGEKFKEQFKTVLDSLDEVGYNNYWRVLNAKDYGMPQARERVFIVSIRKDLDNGKFSFPKPTKLTKCMEDFLETSVDRSYYVPEDKLKNMEKNDSKKEWDLKERSLWHIDTGWSWIPDSLDYEKSLVNIDRSCLQVAYMNYSSYEMSNRVYSPKGCCPTLMASSMGNESSSCKIMVNDGVRMLTEREYLRLTGFDDKDVDALKRNNFPVARMYKVAGNSIVVNVLEALFKSIYSGNERLLG